MLDRIQKTYLRVQYMLLITNVNSSFLPNGKVNSSSNQRTKARYVFLPPLYHFQVHIILMEVGKINFLHHCNGFHGLFQSFLCLAIIYQQLIKYKYHHPTTPLQKKPPKNIIFKNRVLISNMPATTYFLAMIVFKKKTSLASNLLIFSQYFFLKPSHLVTSIICFDFQVCHPLTKLM